MGVNKAAGQAWLAMTVYQYLARERRTYNDGCLHIGENCRRQETEAD